jgi:hypothetical protein
MSVGMLPDKSPAEQAVTVPPSSLQPVDPFAGSDYDFTAFAQMLASSSPWYSFPGSAQGQRAFGRLQDADAAYTASLTSHQSMQYSLRPTTISDGVIFNSRKRAVDDTAFQVSKRHRPRFNNAENLGASFSCTETYPDLAGPVKVSSAGAAGSTMFRETDSLLEPSIPEPQLHIPTYNNDDNYAASSSSMTVGIRPPTSLKPHIHFKRLSYSRNVPRSPHNKVRTRICAIKTTLSVSSGRRETTRARYTWTRKLIREPRKIEDVTTLFINNIYFKSWKREPRV